MEQYLNTGIKEVIQSFPQVGEILGQYGIGCVTCAVGTCLLRDVVQIHGLSKDQETMLMSRLQKAIYPELQLELPGILPQSGPPEIAKPKFSPPLRRLVDEHEQIKRLLSFIPVICDTVTIQLDHQLINDCIYFIRNYADSFHHAKEEEILFSYIDGEPDIVKVMVQEHQNGRNFVRSIVGGLEAGNAQQICAGFFEYRNLLQQHIQKEDEILYPWIDRNLSTRQVGELMARFNEVTRNFGKEITDDFDEFLKTLEAKFKADPQNQANTRDWVAFRSKNRPLAPEKGETTMLCGQ